MGILKIFVNWRKLRLLGRQISKLDDEKKEKQSQIEVVKDLHEIRKYDENVNKIAKMSSKQFLHLLVIMLIIALIFSLLLGFVIDLDIW